MDKAISRQYFNDHAQHWDETVRNNDPAKLQALANRLEFSESAHVLDVGTGTGVFIPYLKTKLHPHGSVTSVDFAFQMVVQAKRKIRFNHKHLVCAEIENFAAPAAYFDAVVCYSTFPHFHDKPAALENIFRLTRTGGRVFICHTASREAINAIHRNIPDFVDHLIPNESEMAALLKNAGFRDLDILASDSSYLALASKP